MAIKSDKWIRKMALDHGMIEPFEDRQVRQGVVSYGVSSYGYDCRVGNEFKVFTNVYNTVVDPKTFRLKPEATGENPDPGPRTPDPGSATSVAA